jgi:hypothetical protein
LDVKKIDFIVGGDDGALRMCRPELSGLAVKDTRLFFDNKTDRAASNYKRPGA